MFFSWFPLGSRVLVAFPVQTNCFVPGSYISRTSVPLEMVELVAEPIPPQRARTRSTAFPDQWQSDSRHKDPPCRHRSSSYPSRLVANQPPALFLDPQFGWDERHLRWRPTYRCDIWKSPFRA